MKKYVNVQFADGIGHNPFEQKYQFLTDLDGLQAGDKVVVDTRNGMKVASVVDYSEVPNRAIKAFKWVVQKIDTKSHNERLKKERKMYEIKRKMDERRKQLEEIQLFSLLAKEDDSMKELLEEYQELNK